jgi:hypothetical protein
LSEKKELELTEYQTERNHAFDVFTVHFGIDDKDNTLCGLSTRFMVSGYTYKLNELDSISCLRCNKSLKKLKKR